MADIALNSFVVNGDDVGDGSEGSDLGSLSNGGIERCLALFMRCFTKGGSLRYLIFVASQGVYDK